MIPGIFNDPHNLWGTWAAADPKRQYPALLLLVLALLYPPCQGYWNTIQAEAAVETELQELHRKLHHQQQILAVLKHRSAQIALTPELASRLLPINRKVQELSGGLQIKDSRWQFEPQITLHLQVTGRFNDLKPFLTDLLGQSPQLTLIGLHIQRTEEEGQVSVQSNISLQLPDIIDGQHKEHSAN